MDQPRRVIYVSYDGLGDPLGRSQVLPYVEGLANRGHTFELVTFEKPGVRLRVHEPLAPGVHWTALRYHRIPTVPATALDMLQGLTTVALTGLLRHADLVHVRSYVPAALAIPWAVASHTPLLFDMRGMWPDEKVDGGAWPADGGLYRATKRIERTLLARASAISVLTHSMRRHLRNEHPHRAEIHASISVIPTCTDLHTFRPDVPPNAAVRSQLPENAKVLVYVGSLGTWYMSEEMARFYLAWRRAVAPAPTRLLLVTRDDPTTFSEVLAAEGVAAEIIHHPAEREEVPGLVRCGDAAMCFIRPTFSKRGSAPTKLGELLACGLPVAANIVGDMAEVLHDTPAGVVVERMTDEEFGRAARELSVRASSPHTADAARALAVRWFGLERAVDRYDQIYATASQHPRGAAGDGNWPE